MISKQTDGERLSCTWIPDQHIILAHERKLLDPNPQDQKYINKFKEIQLGISINERALVLTPRMLFTIEEILPDIGKRLEHQLYKQNIRNSWDVSPILPILSKSLLEESTKYSSWIYKRIALQHASDGSPLICDLCSGAGITSSKVFIELKNRGIKRVQIHAVDNSIESLSASSLLFYTQGIPFTLLTDVKYINTIPYDYDGVVLIYSDITEYMEMLDSNVKYSSVVSENGISYFPIEIHNKILNGHEKSSSSESEYLFVIVKSSLHCPPIKNNS